MSCTQIVAACSSVFCPGAAIEMSRLTISAMSPCRAADEPEPTSSVMVEQRVASTGGTRPNPDRLAGRKQGGHRGLVVEVAGVDVPGWISSCGSKAIQSPTLMPAHEVLGVMGRGVDPHLDMLPAHRLAVDLVAERVTRGLQRQAGTAEVPAVGEDREPAAFGKTRRPMTDRAPRRGARWA